MIKVGKANKEVCFVLLAWHSDSAFHFTSSFSQTLCSCLLISFFSAQCRFCHISQHRSFSSSSFGQLKGIVHPEMKIQSLSTHPHAVGRPGEVFYSIKHCWSFTEKRCCSNLPNNCTEWWLSFKHKKSIIKPKNSSILLIQSNPSVLKPQHARLWVACKHRSADTVSSGVIFRRCVCTWTWLPP